MDYSDTGGMMLNFFEQGLSIVIGAREGVLYYLASVVIFRLLRISLGYYDIHRRDWSKYRVQWKSEIMPAHVKILKASVSSNQNS